jgi:hypothetical protein
MGVARWMCSLRNIAGWSPNGSSLLEVQFKKYCGVEQLVARWAHNPKVIGSSPVPATNKAMCNLRVAFFFFIY